MCSLGDLLHARIIEPLVEYGAGTIRLATRSFAVGGDGCDIEAMFGSFVAGNVHKGILRSGCWEGIAEVTEE